MKAALGAAIGLLSLVAALGAQSRTSAVPRGFDPESVATASANDVWILGGYPCGSGSGWCNAIVRTVDGGRRWLRAPSPSPGVGSGSPQSPRVRPAAAGLCGDRARSADLLRLRGVAIGGPFVPTCFRRGARAERLGSRVGRVDRDASALARRRQELRDLSRPVRPRPRRRAGAGVPGRRVGRLSHRDAGRGIEVDRRRDSLRAGEHSAVLCQRGGARGAIGSSCRGRAQRCGSSGAAPNHGRRLHVVVCGRSCRLQDGYFA